MNEFEEKFLKAYQADIKKHHPAVFLNPGYVPVTEVATYYSICKDIYSISLFPGILETTTYRNHVDIGGQESIVSYVLLMLGIAENSTVVDIYDYRANCRPTTFWAFCKDLANPAFFLQCRDLAQLFMTHFGHSSQLYESILNALRVAAESAQRLSLLENKLNYIIGDYSSISALTSQISKYDLVTCMLALPYFNPRRLLGKIAAETEKTATVAILTDSWFSLDNCAHILLEKPWDHLLMDVHEIATWATVNFGKDVGASYYKSYMFYHCQQNKYCASDIIASARKEGFELNRYALSYIMGPDSNERWHVCPNELLANCDPGRLRRIKEAYPSLEVAELSSKFTVYEFSKK